ncbi:hypothetical protein P7C70_g4049, partial [Phenoliferia sp. Uapishka_3]
MSTLHERARAFQARLAASGAVHTPAQPSPPPNLPSPTFTPTHATAPINGFSAAPSTNPDRYSQFYQESPQWEKPTATPGQRDFVTPSGQATVDQLRLAHATDQVKILENRLQQQTLLTIQLNESIRNKDDEALKGRAEIQRLRKASAELEAYVRDKSRELDSMKQSMGQPRTFVRFASIEEAYATFSVDAKIADRELHRLYESLVTASPKDAKIYKGALFSIAMGRPSLHHLTQDITSAEISSYLKSIAPDINLADLPSVLSVLPEVNDATQTEYDDDMLLTTEREKARIAGLDAKLGLAKKDVEAKIIEVKTWRLKAENLEKQIAAAPSRKAAVLTLEVEKAAEEKKRLEKELSVTKSKLEKSEEAKKLAVESVAKAEQSINELNALKKELASEKRKLKGLEGELESARSATALTVDVAPSASVSAPPGSGAEKFVITQLAKTVQKLSAELTAKTAENADLMMRLAQARDEN